MAKTPEEMEYSVIAGEDDCTDPNNLHLIDSNVNTGFALYRLGAPDEFGVKQLCNLGVSEIVVMSGNAADYEEKYKAACPSLKVVYNELQDAQVPATKDFLNFFDNWIQEAQAKGKKVAFRCNCGCHRTGRLAAYYQMKYQGMSIEDATILMNKHGKYMIFLRFLEGQVLGLYDYIKGRPCNLGDKYCIKNFN